MIYDDIMSYIISYHIISEIHAVTFNPEERATGIYWVGQLLDFRTNLDALVAKRNVIVFTWDETVLFFVEFEGTKLSDSMFK
jgi:hypothetical protein